MSRGLGCLAQKVFFNMLITILDYGVGNLFSIKCSFERIGYRANVCSDPGMLKRSDLIVLPGVGNFETASRNIENVRDILVELVSGSVLAFGICLGTHLFFLRSDEGSGKGLGILSGKVARLPESVRTPHMGWNNLRIVRQLPILSGISEHDYFYFAHSYYASPSDGGIVAAETDYGIKFPAAISSGNVIGVQFHPEKSGDAGERLIRNLVNIVRR